MNSTNLMSDQLRKGYIEKHASFVAVLAFRCAWQDRAKRELAGAEALKAYLAIHPHDRHASDNVVDAIVEAVRLRPHWLTVEN